MKSRLFLYVDLNLIDKVYNFLYGILKILDLSIFMVKWVKRLENIELIYEVYVIIVFFYYLSYLIFVFCKLWIFWDF